MAYPVVTSAVVFMVCYACWSDVARDKDDDAFSNPEFDGHSFLPADVKDCVAHDGKVSCQCCEEMVDVTFTIESVVCHQWSE